jgi:type II secretory pathway pseudopilin PulG
MELKHLVSNQCALRRRSGGFTLTEVTWAMFFLGVSAVALLSGFTGGFFNIQLSRENLRATQIMLEKTETLRLYSWDQVNSNGFIPTNFTALYDPNAPQGSRGLTYNGTMTISPAPIADSSYSNDVKMVSVVVNWRTGGIGRTRQFTTYIARNGLQNYIY